MDEECLRAFALRLLMYMSALETYVTTITGKHLPSDMLDAHYEVDEELRRIVLDRKEVL
jgi:hypothetical protein